ncbi:MAG: dihydroorotate dehydrogenase-like protein [Armatimonadota bacterium]|nr:dihydroorotate dehydrogenase-like protein [Armatimonadota bacterium]MDR7548733.1 dihydroorotate dehydrogenase-like protein [Armatimonadota bacterium]
MDLSTTYLGLSLPHPLMPGASPLVDDLDTVKRLEDAGAAAIIMHSLFEEQIVQEQLATVHHMEVHAESFPEALSYFPRPSEFALGPEQYLRHLERIKRAVGVPVIASLNGVTTGGWMAYARRMQEAGADAIELNVYYLATDPQEPAAAVEGRTLDILRAVRTTVSIPIAVKLSPFFSSLAHFAAELDAAGADGLVLFNRFYQPEIDIETLDVVPRLELSSSGELLLRLRWLAVLSGRVSASLAVSGGVHSATDAIKAIMAGADAVQMVSALLRHGPGYLRLVRQGLEAWMTEHGYTSLAQMRGSMSLSRCPDPAAFERSNYIRVLQGWRA